MTDEERSTREYRRRDLIQYLRCIEVQARDVRVALEENRFEPELTDFGVQMIVSAMSRDLAVFQIFTNSSSEEESA